MDFKEAVSYLLSLGHETLTIKLGLKNTETLLNALGNPQADFPAVQIAGTNGKGSVAVTLDSICRKAGIRTGLFTSPHLVSITERIQIEGEMIWESDFARFTDQVKQAAEQLVKQGKLETLPTFFEHVTAITLLAFREAKVELVILETGLGGRLDSTTAAGAEIVAITPIAMDHEEYLGHSLAQIAAEKAAIIRPGVIAVIAPQKEEALEVIVCQCDASGVEATFIEDIVLLRHGYPLATASGSVPGNRSRFRTERFSTEDGRFCVTFETAGDQYEGVSLGLRGRHQIPNTAVAINLAEALRERGFEISREAIVQGVERATHPGRLEMWEGQPRILFDGAHNPAAARALRDYLDEFVKQSITMIFGAMRDKALGEMAAALLPAANAVILTQLDNPRGVTHGLLNSALPKNFDQDKVSYASSAYDALRIAKELTPSDGFVCVTGSLYLIGAVQQALREQNNNSSALLQSASL